VRVFRHLRHNVIAYAALFVALSGSAVAAGVALPRNSVGTAQLQANAVVSAKVRNGSLLVADFRPGQIPSGPPGATGPVGPAGPRGLQVPRDRQAPRRRSSSRSSIPIRPRVPPPASSRSPTRA
jgi:hypothetical protein